MDGNNILIFSKNRYIMLTTISWLWHKVLVNTTLHASNLPDSRSGAVGGEHGSAPPQIVFQI